MRVKATHATIKEIVAHADKVVRAFRRLQNDLTTVVAPAPEDVRQKVAALLFDMNVIPVESIFALRAIAEFYEDEFDRIEKQADAVRKCRERQAQGMPSPRRPYAERKGPRAIPKTDEAERPPEIYSSEEYEEIVRRAREAGATPLSQTKNEPENLPEDEPKPAPEPQSLIDATPTRGGGLTF